MSPCVLALNPGSTSTKIAVYQDGAELFAENLPVSAERASRYPSIMDQLSFREDQVRDSLERRRFDRRRLAAVVGRGGLLRPLSGGVYRVGPSMIEDLRAARYGEHASNLGAVLAQGLARELGIEAFIADPVVVDELDEVAAVSGNALFRRRSVFHALNQKAVARR